MTSKARRIYITSRGYYPHDIINWSIPMRPTCNDIDAIEVMSAIAGITTARFVWSWKKPSKKQVAELNPSTLRDSLSLLRWTIWWNNHGEHKPYGYPTSPTWLANSESKWVSIPFANPIYSAWAAEWSRPSYRKNAPSREIPEAMQRIFDVFSDYVWSPSYYSEERPGKSSEITSVTFKASHPSIFVKNITKE